MSMEDQIRWDEQHRSTHGSGEPSAFLREIFAAKAWDIPKGPALDIAAGKGRNALFLAERGFDVLGIDISETALAEAARRAAANRLAVTWRQGDLEKIDLPKAGYELIINFNYLQRSLIAPLKSALKINGYVVFETYLTDQAAVGHPKNPAHLLGHNELLRLFHDFRILSYREGQFAEFGERAFRAGLFAQRVD